jgi:hypothetical protein
MEILPFSAMHLTHNYSGPCDNNFRMISLLIVSSAMPRSAERSIGMLSMAVATVALQIAASRSASRCF